MTRFKLLFVAVTLLIAPMAFAGTYTLSDWCFYVNSLDINQSCNSGSGLANVPVAAPGVTDLLHLQADNTGTLTATLAPGNYNVFAIFNYNIDGSGLNEYARTFGQLSVGQVYSVNNEGSAGAASSLFGQGVGGSLDNTNHLPSCTASPCPDTAVALGYTGIVVPAGNSGIVTFTIGTTPPSGPGTFYVQQTNTTTQNSLYFSATYVDPPGVPEPATMGLMASGFGAMLWFVRRRKA